MKTIIISIVFCFGVIVQAKDLAHYFSLAGENRVELEKAVDKVPFDQSRGMHWLIKHMPDDDLKTLSAEFLLENCSLAYEALENIPWISKVPENIFFDAILPYASLNERRDNWRGDFGRNFFPLVKSAGSAYEAAAQLNQNIYKKLGVIYSTKRPKADQSPYESIDAGLASCTGLSILLIDACRSVGIPARFVGTPMWYNNSGNHSWVEIWDEGWHYTGAAEPTGNKLNQVWFSELASKAKKGDMKYGIFASTWNYSRNYFPMDWLPEVKTYRSIDVTEKYSIYLTESLLVPIRIKAVDPFGLRKSVNVTIKGQKIIFKGKSKDETFDANDHLTVMLPRGQIFTIESREDIQTLNVKNEQLISLKTTD
tara:strand:- start:188 stop:1291 length:1104 start_codon:yes stop_codon:yes gene_type:complete